MDNHLKDLSEGAFVAILLANYDKFPVFGKVLSYTDQHFKIHYLKGSYNTQWHPHMLYKGRIKATPWTDELPLKCIILAGFQLDDNFKLMNNQKKYLKSRYEEHANK